MSRHTYVVLPGFDGTDYTNYCFALEEDREEHRADVLERVSDLLDDGETVTVYDADDDLPSCDECEAEDCKLREKPPPDSP